MTLSVLNRKSSQYTPDESRVELEEKQQPKKSALLVEDGNALRMDWGRTFI